MMRTLCVSFLLLASSFARAGTVRFESAPKKQLGEYLADFERDLPPDNVMMKSGRHTIVNGVLKLDVADLPDQELYLIQLILNHKRFGVGNRTIDLSRAQIEYVFERAPRVSDSQPHIVEALHRKDNFHTVFCGLNLNIEP